MGDGRSREVDWHWWGFTLYLSHRDLMKIPTPSSLFDFLRELMPELAPVLDIISPLIGGLFSVMKKDDKGNGSWAEITFVGILKDHGPQ